mmetsp:Transcript_6283/g.9626  ORF Transcript_6283/g.9626 Transcript_6283/m.9626 type:complete len:209 (+) Transcript_6283:2562-3188(+)
MALFRGLSRKLAIDNHSLEVIPIRGKRVFLLIIIMLFHIPLMTPHINDMRPCCVLTHLALKLSLNNLRTIVKLKRNIPVSHHRDLNLAVDVNKVPVRSDKLPVLRIREGMSNQSLFAVWSVDIPIRLHPPCPISIPFYCLPQLDRSIDQEHTECPSEQQQECNQHVDGPASAMPKRARPLVIVPVRTQVNYGVPADRLAGAKSHGGFV